MLDFAETARLAFQSGPVRIRKYARLFGAITNVIICFAHYQSAVIYILYVATSCQQVYNLVIFAPKVGTIKQHYLAILVNEKLYVRIHEYSNTASVINFF